MYTGDFYTFRNEAIFKDEFTSVTSAHANLVQFLVRREAREAAFNDKRSDASRTFLWLRLCIHHES